MLTVTRSHTHTMASGYRPDSYGPDPWLARQEARAQACDTRLGEGCERAFRRHPATVSAAALLLTGCAMVAAVAVFTLAFLVPACLLAGLM